MLNDPSINYKIALFNDLPDDRKNNTRVYVTGITDALWMVAGKEHKVAFLEVINERAGSENSINLTVSETRVVNSFRSQFNRLWRAIVGNQSDDEYKVQVIEWLLL